MTEHTYTQTTELLRSYYNPVHFARTHIFKKPLTPNQHYWLGTSDQSVDLGSVRCSYRTTTMIAKLLHIVGFSQDRTCVFITHNVHGCESARQQLIHMLNGLPEGMKPNVRQLSRYSVELENGCGVKFTVASETACRGLTVDAAFIDNRSLIRPDALEAFRYAIMPCLVPSTSLIMCAD